MPCSQPRHPEPGSLYPSPSIYDLQADATRKTAFISALKETSSGGLLDNAGSCSPLAGVRPGETRRRKKQEVAGASELSDPRGCTPSCQPGFLVDLSVHGFRGRGRGRPDRRVCASFWRGTLLFSSWLPARGSKLGGGGVYCIGMWDVGWAQVSFSLLFTLSGRALVSPCLIRFLAALHLPGMFPIGRHFDCWCIGGGCTADPFGYESEGGQLGGGI